jgi:hypothetical protein
MECKQLHGGIVAAYCDAKTDRGPGFLIKAVDTIGYSHHSLSVD